jgi:hypothetical protein
MTLQRTTPTSASSWWLTVQIYLDQLLAAVQNRKQPFDRDTLFFPD